MLLADAGQRLLDFVIRNGNFLLFGAQLLVALNLYLGHDFEAGLELQRLAIMDMEIADTRLGYRDQSLFFGLLPKVLGHKRFDDFALDILAESLPNDRGGDVSFAETGQTSEFLILLN